MIQLFYNLYNSIRDKNAFLKRIRFYSVLRYLTRVLANLTIGFYYRLTRNNPKYKLMHPSDSQLIISLTSFPGRTANLWMVIESLLRQTVKPDKIILYLSKNQFDGIQSLPLNLRLMQDRGVEIQFVEDDLRSHKKYFYAFRDYPDRLVMTVDDDVFYHPRVVESLLQLHQKYPQAICCHLASIITLEQGKIAPYLQWVDAKDEQISPNGFMPVGMGGILYPPGCMHELVLNSDVFRQICFHADDLWLNMMSRLNQTPVAKSSMDLICLPVMNQSDFSLTNMNVFGGENDKQLNAVRNYLSQNLKDPLCDLEMSKNAADENK